MISSNYAPAPLEFFAEITCLLTELILAHLLVSSDQYSASTSLLSSLDLLLIFCSLFSVVFVCFFVLPNFALSVGDG